MATKASPAVMTVTVRDVEWTLDPNVFDDWELLERLNSQNIAEQMVAVADIFGPEQTAAAKELVRDPDTGRVSLEGMLALFIDISKALTDSGNS